jgi:hypothetical protein
MVVQTLFATLFASDRLGSESARPLEQLSEFQCSPVDANWLVFFRKSPLARKKAEICQSVVHTNRHRRWGPIRRSACDPHLFEVSEGLRVLRSFFKKAAEIWTYLIASYVTTCPEPLSSSEPFELRRSGIASSRILPISRSATYCTWVMSDCSLVTCAELRLIMAALQPRAGL